MTEDPVGRIYLVGVIVTLLGVVLTAAYHHAAVQAGRWAADPDDPGPVGHVAIGTLVALVWPLVALVGVGVVACWTIWGRLVWLFALSHRKAVARRAAEAMERDAAERCAAEAKRARVSLGQQAWIVDHLALWLSKHESDPIFGMAAHAVRTAKAEIEDVYWRAELEQRALAEIEAEK